MRLSIDGGGYATAATAFADANQVAALQHDSLTGKLGSYAAMAGDDATSAGFATAYDTAAAEATAALADLVSAFAHLGRLTEQSLANHRAANLAAVMTGAHVYDGTTLPETGYVSVLPSTPPSSLGGDPPPFSFQENWVLDHVEGFVWPNADTARLRDAAHLWRSAAEGLDHLTTYCDAAIRAFQTQRSPEIPVATDATASLRDTVRDLAGQYAALAASCESYAGDVEAAHERTRALLREVLAMVVEGVVISVAIGLISAGAGAVVGGGAVVARVASQSPRFAAILTALRLAVTTSAHGLRTTHANVRAIRVRLDRYLGVPVRSEAGHLTVSPQRWGPGFLGAHEGRGHALSRHVGKDLEELAARFDGSNPPRMSSTFPDTETAEREVLRLMRSEQGMIDDWLRSNRAGLVLQGESGRIVGTCLDRMGNVLDGRGVRLVLQRDASMADGFFIKSAYPTP